MAYYTYKWLLQDYFKQKKFLKVPLKFNNVFRGPDLKVVNTTSQGTAARRNSPDHSKPENTYHCTFIYDK